jgi:hypothetical protein
MECLLVSKLLCLLLPVSYRMFVNVSKLVCLLLPVIYSVFLLSVSKSVCYPQ